MAAILNRPQYVWNGTAWVPVAPGAIVSQPAGTSLVTDPAIAGPRALDPTQARFTHKDDGDNGFMVTSGGLPFVIAAAGTEFAIHELTTPPSTFTKMLGLTKTQQSFLVSGVEMFRLSDRPHFYGNPVVEGASAAIDVKKRDNQSRQMALYGQGEDIYLYDSAVGNLLTVRNQGSGVKLGAASGGWFGKHPIHTGHVGFWSGESANEAWFLTNSGEALINAYPGYGIYLRINQASIISVTDASVRTHRQVISDYGAAVSASWNYSQFVATQSADGRLSLNGAGVAPQIRGTTAEGDTVSGINQTGSGYCPFKGLPYVTVSTMTRKHSIATFGRERERIAVRDWQADEVPQELSIMDLRPVTFRHNEPEYRITDDGESVPRDASTILGRQRLRENLGLVAEEVATVIPSAVVYDDNGENPGIDYTQVTVALLEHVQRLTDQIATLQYRIAELEAR